MAWGAQPASPAPVWKSAETVVAANTIAPSPLTSQALSVEGTKHQPLFLCSDFLTIPPLGSILRQVRCFVSSSAENFPFQILCTSPALLPRCSIPLPGAPCPEPSKPKRLFFPAPPHKQDPGDGKPGGTDPPIFIRSLLSTSVSQPGWMEEQLPIF